MAPPSDRDASGRTLGDGGIGTTPRYDRKPAFRCEVFEKQRTFGSSPYPFTLARPEALRYDPARFPGAFALLDAILVLPWSERCTEADVDRLARAIRRAAGVR